MKIYLDSSALAKRYVAEHGSEVVLERCRDASRIGVSILAYPEVISGLNRLRRERKLDEKMYSRLKRDLCLDLEGAEVVGLTPEVVALAVRCLELEPVRAADAIHVATAREFACNRFLSADRARCAAAERLGLRAELV